MDLYKYNEVILPRVEWNENLYPYIYIVTDTSEEKCYLYGSEAPLIYDNSLGMVTQKEQSTILIYKLDENGSWSELEETENVWLSEIVWSNTDIFDLNGEKFFSGTKEEYYQYVPPTEFIFLKELNNNPILPPVYVKKNTEQTYKLIFELVPEQDAMIPTNLSAIVEYQKQVEENVFVTIKKGTDYEVIDGNKIIIYLNKNMTSRVDNFYLKITFSGSNNWTNTFPIELIVEE